MTVPIMPRTAEWLAARKLHVTATDIARIMCDGAAWTVFGEKTGLVEPFAGNDDTRDGQDLEEAILRIYARRRQCEIVHPMPLVVDPSCPALAATPDAMWQDRSRLVEAKSSKSRAVLDQLGDEDTDDLPDKWVWQGTSQLACCDMELVEFPVFIFGTLKVYRLKRNETLVAQCRSVATEMMQRIAANDPPPMNFDSPDVQKYVKAIKPTAGTTIDLSDEAAALWAKREAASKAEGAAKKEKKAADAEMRAIFGTAESGTLPDGGVLRIGTVQCPAQTQEAYEYRRFFLKKPPKETK